MRVLWFVEKPLPAVTARQGTPPIHHGSWLDQLEVALRGTPDFELGVAAPSSWSDAPLEPFASEGVTYFTLSSDECANPYHRVAQRWWRLFEPEVDVRPCLQVATAFRPDLIHVHGTENPFGLLAATHSATPVVISIQGILSVYELLEARGKDASLRVSFSPSLFVRGGGTALQGTVLRGRAARERRIFRSCKHFIGRTRFDADVVRVMSPDARYHHCDELLRPEFFTAVWHRRQRDSQTVFSTGGGYARKGLGTLLRAVAILRTSCMPTVRLRLAGTSSTGSEEGRAMARQIRRLGLSDRVTSLGRLDADDLARELLGAGVFVLSTHADNSPNSLAEAMMMGVPCVASAAGGIPSLARDGVEALLVQDGDPYALAGAIARLLEDEGLASQLSTNARAAALARHDPQKVRAEILAVYRAILEDERRAASDVAQNQSEAVQDAPPGAATRGLRSREGASLRRPPRG